MLLQTARLLLRNADPLRNGRLASFRLLCPEADVMQKVFLSDSEQSGASSQFKIFVYGKLRKTSTNIFDGMNIQTELS